MAKNDIPTAVVPARPRIKVRDLIILAICLALFAVRAITSMVQESSTWDETHYFGMGKYLLQTGRWDVQGCILHPPLSYYLSSIPLLFFQPMTRSGSTIPDTNVRGSSV